MNNRFTLYISFLIIVFLVVAGGIVWVHYRNLPHLAVEYQSATSTATTTATDSTAPSLKTAEAMAAIEKITKGLPTGYLDMIPIPRVLHPASTTEVATFSELGFTFNVPKNGIVMTLMRAVTISTTTLAQWTSVSSTIKTNYDWENAVLNATPGQVVSSTPEDQAVLTSLLLDQKLLLLPPTPVYSFSTKVIRGFQHGNATPTKQIAIEFFNQESNGYVMTIAATQGEIDYVLNSVKPK
jgi:hypothetical protein